MLRVSFAITAAVLSLCSLASQQEFSGPEQARRGYALFFDSPKAACGSCHALSGRGTPAGPDLKVIARVPPRGLATAILSTRTQYVQEVKLKSGQSFPAMPVKQDDQTAEYYDLARTPPELRKLARSDIESVRDNENWKHPPASADLTSQELADLIAYIKYAVYKYTGTVKPEDVE
ncbi:MAG: c-type cytochrome [Bryobacterales bacterium]|nr:c-type cytochrome [Bryobacteraceae bacterium]MDW8355027.1 c-type cytochrome [Bryobacterales bacterium]